MLRNMFRKTYTKTDTKYRPVSQEGEEPSIPEGLWRKCNKCGQPIYVEDVKQQLLCHAPNAAATSVFMLTAGSRCLRM